MPTNKVSIIIPCYWANQHLVDVTKQCLSSLYFSKIDEVIVVDDGSRIDMTVAMPDFKPLQEAIVIKRKENGGYAAAVNTGLEKASGNTLVICNNDIEFIQPDWLEHLIKPLDTYDIMSIRTTDVDGWNTEDRIEEGAKFGSLWAMKRKVYETIGGFDETFGKGYFEDLDYKTRAEGAGFRIAKNHAGIVHHIGKSTFGIVDPDDTHYLRAKEIYKQKWGYVD